MLLASPLVGKRIVLRSVIEDDADFILKLRMNPDLNQFIHDTDPSPIKQREWIKAQQQRPDDYYMIIEDLGQRRLGTVSVYNIDRDAKRFEWGRWLIVPGTPFHVAAESALLVYSFAFNELSLDESVFVVKTRNSAVCSYFENVLDSEIIERDEEDTRFRFRRQGLPGLLERLKNFHNLD